MCRYVLAVCVVLTAGTAAVMGQCSDPFDNVLCAYPLTTEQEQAVSFSDGAVTPFWNDATWEGRDYFEMVAPDDCYPGRCNFTDESDARTLIKAAASGIGLYLYAEVDDNVWVDRAGPGDYGADAMDIYFDAMAANEIFTCTDCRIGLNSTTLTFTSQQFQVFMGGSSVPTEFTYQYYDDIIWSWTSVQLTFPNAEALYGFKAEVIQVSPTQKVQEWFVPWSFYGKGLPPGTDLSGKLLGFTGGYNDKDGDNAQADCLRWLGKDPWAADAQQVNYWGDLYLPPTKVVEPRGGRSASLSRRGVPCHDAEVFTLRGELLKGGHTGRSRSPGLMVQRARLEDGGHRTAMVRVGL